MSGTRCAVATCNNSIVKTRNKRLDISYHTFPKNAELRETWITACARNKDWNPDTSVICSTHFDEQDFTTDLISQYLNIKTKRRLKSTAVPSLFLPKGKPHDACADQQNMTESDLLQIEFNTVLPVEEQPNSQSISGFSEIIIQDESLIEEAEPLEPDCVYVQEPLIESHEYEVSGSLVDPSIPGSSKQTMAMKYKMLLEETDTMEMKYKNLMASCEKQNKETKNLEKWLSQSRKRYKEEHISKQKLEMAINSIFSDVQRDIIVNKAKEVVWERDDILKAFTLKRFRSSCYSYVRDILKYPLPHPETLAKWNEKLKSEAIPLPDFKEELRNEFRRPDKIKIKVEEV